VQVPNDYESGGIDRNTSDTASPPNTQETYEKHLRSAPKRYGDVISFQRGVNVVICLDVTYQFNKVKISSDVVVDVIITSRQKTF